MLSESPWKIMMGTFSSRILRGSFIDVLMYDILLEQTICGENKNKYKNGHMKWFI